jgi:endonuclease/exonuclease/phosphatase family metal-dependent hydrolase
MAARILLLSAAIWLIHGAAARAEQPPTLRVLSYNIHHGEGIDGKLDLERIARVISSVEPDVVAVQEVDQRVQRSGVVDQPAELARLTQMQVVFGGNITYQGGNYGNVVLSRHPIRRHENHKLPRLNDGEQRGVLIAEIDWPGHKEPLLFFSTHLDHRRERDERLASAKAINELAARYEGRPAVLAGDLNDVTDSPVLAEFLRQWGATSDKPLATIPVASPSRQIDFILVRPKDAWRTVEIRVLDEATASDHRPILAVVRLQPMP